MYFEAKEKIPKTGLTVLKKIIIRYIVTETCRFIKMKKDEITYDHGCIKYLIIYTYCTVSNV